MLPSMMNQPFIRKRYPEVLDHGTLSVDYDATPTFATFYGSIQPGAGTEDQINRDGAEIVYMIFARGLPDIGHQDLITLAEGTFFVNGPPEKWGTGILNHTVVKLSKWVG